MGAVYVGFRAAWSLLWALTFALSLVYQVDVAGLTPFQLVLVGTVLEATCFVAEIPTGVVADLRSRKLSVLIGLVLIGAGALLYAWPSFWPILAAQVVWGVGYTFVSGAAEAWVTDEVGADAMQPVFTRAHQWGLGCDIAGILLAGAVAVGAGSLQAPLIAGGLGFLLLAGVLMVLMQERNFTPVPAHEVSNVAQMVEITRAAAVAVRRPGLVRTLLLISLLTGLASEVFDRLWVDRVVREFSLPAVAGADSLAVWFTGFALVASLIGLGASLVANRWLTSALTAEHPRAVMAVLAGLSAGGVAVFALSGNLWLALGGVWLREASDSVAAPIRTAWLNRNVGSRTRATVGSMMGQADALGQVVGGPALGALASLAGVPVALLVAAGVQAPTAALYARSTGGTDGTREQ